MISIRQRFIPVLLALGLGAASLTAYAKCEPDQTREGRPGKHAQSRERMQEHFDKRHQSLGAALALQPGQEAAWNTYLEKSRPDASGRREGKKELAGLSAPERMERLLGAMRQREQRMTTRLTAMKELYAILTPEQQKIFDKAFPARHRRGQ